VCSSLSSHEESYDYSNPKVWFSRAQITLSEAERAADNQNKARLAIEAAELALKSLLVKKGCFTEKDETHKLSDLFDKLKKCGALQSPEKVKELVGKIERVQAYHKVINTKVEVCNEEQVGNLRYPLKEELEISSEIAEQKCNVARSLLNIVKEEMQR